ncbi:MAG: DUF4277 domain-containing protein, partial [Proteobacteria bacterium]|nr:DUF4277 domain-containing protein [Pseudomonadota bacterium]
MDSLLMICYMRNLNHKNKEILMDVDFKSVNAYPLVKHYMERLGLMAVFKEHIPKGREHAEPAECLCVMIANIILAPRPLYRIEEWLADYADCRGAEPVSANLFNDDRLARSLDGVFAAPRQAMTTEISLNAIRVHQLETDRIHNDSTTITFSGEYGNQTSKTVQLVPGYNKDHRPD